ncbi:hypothetical protein U1Q18_049675 [Sarracenia purpurea var. burkii]
MIGDPFQSLRMKVKDSSGNPVENNTPPKGKPLSDTMRGKGFLGNVDNSVFDKFQDAMEKLTKPGDSTPIRSGDAVAWFKDFHDSNGIYKYYSNSYYDENTEKFYDCSTVIQLPRLKDGNFFSHKQFLETFSKITDSSGTPLVDDMPSKGSPLSGKQKGKGIQLSPV